MNPRRLTPALLALMTALAVGCAPSTNSSEESDDPVSVSIVTSAGFAPFYVSEAQGYFDDVGVEIRTQVVKSGQDAIPLLASGKVDVLVAGFSAGTFSAVASGLEFKVVGSMNLASGDPKKSTTGLYVDKRLVDDGAVRSVSGLKGRKVAVAGGSGAAGGYLLDIMLKPHGLSLSDVTVVNVGSPDMKAALETGGVAAAIPTAPFGSEISNAGVGVPLAVPPKGTSVTGVMYSEEFADSPDARRFLRALRRGAADLQDGRITSRDNVETMAKATGQDAAVLREMPWDSWRPDLGPSRAHLHRMQRTYIDAGLLRLDKPIPVQQFVADIKPSGPTAQGRG